MKKLFLLLTIACLSLSLNAQVFVGLKGGGGISVLTAGGTYAHAPGINIVAGASYKHHVFNRVVLEGNILLDMRSTTALDFPFAGQNYDMPSTYISMPLTAHWIMPFKSKKLVPYRTEDFKTYWYLEAGPHFGYGLSATTYLDPVAAPENPKEIKAGGFDAGVVVGMGINFNFKNSRNKLAIGWRAQYGLLNYNHYDGAPTFNNITAGAYVGYDFKLTKKQQYRYRM